MNIAEKRAMLAKLAAEQPSEADAAAEREAAEADKERQKVAYFLRAARQKLAHYLKCEAMYRQSGEPIDEMIAAQRAEIEKWK